MGKITTIVKDLFDRSLAAKRMAALTGGTKVVDSIVITAGGTGYLSAPTVVFSSGAAAGTAVISGGVVVSVTITARGSYTTPPTVSFTPVSGGSGAAGTVVMSPTSLDAIISLDKTAGEFLVIFPIGTISFLAKLRSGTDAEALPYIVRPDDYAGGTNEKVWDVSVITSGDVLFDFFTNGGNVNAAETTLYTFTVPAMTLLANGQKITGRYGGVISAATSKQIKLKFGGNTIFDTGFAATAASTSWELDFLIIRTGSSTARVIAKITYEVLIAAQESDLTGLDFTTTNVLELTGLAAASNEIIAKLGFGQWLPAA